VRSPPALSGALALSSACLAIAASACAADPPLSARESFEAELGDLVCDVAWPAVCDGERGGHACTYVRAFVPLFMSMLESAGGTFNEAAARRCLVRLRTEPVDGREVRCAAVMRGALRPGEPCTSSFDCAPTDVGVTRCRGEGRPELEGRHVCEVVVRAAIGAPCVPTEHDAPEAVRYVCDSRVAYCSRETERCTAKPVDGEPCSRFASRAEPDAFGCAEGHYCDGSPGHCVIAHGEGQACDGGGGPRRSCAPGLRCGDDLRCERPKQGPGEACFEDAECTVGTCYRGRCDPSEPDEVGDVAVRISCGR
jgi:hypothetical protein